MERIHDLGLAPSFAAKGKTETIWEQACRLVQVETELRIMAENKAKHAQVREGFSFGILEEEADNTQIG